MDSNDLFILLSPNECRRVMQLSIGWSPPRQCTPCAGGSMTERNPPTGKVARLHGQETRCRWYLMELGILIR